jgi:Flp pilus assembly protein TadG
MPLRRAQFGLSARRQGQAAIEFAVLAPLLCLFVVGLVDFGGYIHARAAMTNATRAGASYATTHASSWDSSQPTTSRASIQGQIQGEGEATITNDDTLTITYLDVTASNAVCAIYKPSTHLVLQAGYATQDSCLKPGTLIQVTTTYSYTPTLSWFTSALLGPLTMTATVTYPELH